MFDYATRLGHVIEINYIIWYHQIQTMDCNRREANYSNETTFTTRDQIEKDFGSYQRYQGQVSGNAEIKYLQGRLAILKKNKYAIDCEISQCESRIQTIEYQTFSMYPQSTVQKKQPVSTNVFCDTLDIPDITGT